MYVSHFGLKRLPFENVPDPAFFFDDGEYQRILRRLTSAIGAGRGLMVVAGPIGSGKTTLSQKLLADLAGSTTHLWLAEPPGTDRELFQMLLQRLGARLNWDSRVLALGVVRDLLLKLQAAGGQFLVVIDEAHKVSDEGLEAIRLLNNLEQGAAKLIQILMLGQEELAEALAAPGRETFRQRIANLEILGRMKPPQVRDYVRHRLRVAGGEPELFPDLVLEVVAAAGGGIPRLTNSLCDRALLLAFEAGKTAVDTKDLLKAAEEVGVYRKAFHFLVGRERTAAGPAAAPQSAPSSAPGAPPAPPVPSGPFELEPAAAGPAEPAPWACPPAQSDLGGEVRQPPLRAPLALLAGGVAALAASLLYYCSRSDAPSAGECLAQLLQGLVR